MGDRANIVVRSQGEQVCLYSHWAGHELPGVLQKALQRGVERWGDFRDLTGIIFCGMVDKHSLELTGYGITQKVHGGGSKVITVDVDAQTIKVSGQKATTFSDYAVHGGCWYGAADESLPAPVEGGG